MTWSTQGPTSSDRAIHPSTSSVADVDARRRPLYVAIVGVGMGRTAAPEQNSKCVRRALVTAGAGLALLLGAPRPAHAEEAKKHEVLALGSHQTKDAIHRGHIPGTRADRDPLGVMGKVELNDAVAAPAA